MKTETRALLTLGTAGIIVAATLLSQKFEIGKFSGIRSKVISDLNATLAVEGIHLHSDYVCTYFSGKAGKLLACNKGNHIALSVEFVNNEGPSNKKSSSEIIITGISVNNDGTANGQFNPNSGCLTDLSSGGGEKCNIKPRSTSI